MVSPDFVVLVEVFVQAPFVPAAIDFFQNRFVVHRAGAVFFNLSTQSGKQSKAVSDELIRLCCVNRLNWQHLKGRPIR